MNGVTGVGNAAPANTATSPQQQQQASGLSAQEQEAFNNAVLQAGTSVAVLHYSIMRSIMSSDG
ncbi:MAG: hypothetical protein AAF543_04335 [Pseudomonadota bacterium]